MSDAAHRSDRRRLAVVVWAVLVSQVFLYPGVPTLVEALGAPDAGIDAGMWFLVAEFAAFVTFAGVWGALSDATGRRVALVVVGAVGGGLTYLVLPSLPGLGVGFGGVLLLRVVGGAFTIGAFSLGITMLMDLRGGHGRNMGAAGIAIGFGAAVGSVVGGRLADVDPFYPLYAGGAVLIGAALLASTVSDRTGEASGEVQSGAEVPGEEASSREASTGAVSADGDNRPGFCEIARRMRAMPGLLVPYAFGFIDRLTAGFFALVGVYYFQDPEVFGLSAFGAGLTLALFFLPFALLQYPMGVLSDRIGRFYPVVVGSLAYGAVIAGVGLAPTYPVAALLMVLVGVCGALVAPATMALVTDLVAPSERGAAMGLFNVFGSLGFLTGFLVGGTVTEGFDYLTAFLVVGGLELAIAVVLFPAVRVIAPGTEPGPS